MVELMDFCLCKWCLKVSLLFLMVLVFLVFIDAYFTRFYYWHKSLYERLLLILYIIKKIYLLFLLGGLIHRCLIAICLIQVFYYFEVPPIHKRKLDLSLLLLIYFDVLYKINLVVFYMEIFYGCNIKRVITLPFSNNTSVCICN